MHGNVPRDQHWAAAAFWCGELWRHVSTICCLLSLANFISLLFCCQLILNKKYSLLIPAVSSPPALVFSGELESYIERGRSQNVSCLSLSICLSLITLYLYNSYVQFYMYIFKCVYFIFFVFIYMYIFIYMFSSEKVYGLIFMICTGVQKLLAAPV